ncbi:MAG TPA: methyltransferase, TIGR04325 family [Campylobacterales bacterium]|nr:methyltransferase, TIGR04325 family [Campylobacterales bacterium]
MKKFIKSFIPPIMLSIVKKYKKQTWQGDYNSWQESQMDSTGYDGDEILNKVKNSLLKVKNGEAVYERDSIVFDEIHYSWSLLAGLMLAYKERLNVLDFGGSLGSTYFQNKKFLDELDNVSWSIVEQEHFVDVGKKEFEDNRLRFYHTVDESVAIQQPNVLLLSSVLQYLEKPYEMLDEILGNDFEYILIDRTPFSRQQKDIIKMQVVPEYIYKASYPCWFFDEGYFNKYFIEKGYRLIESFDGADGKSQDYYFKGMIWKKDV